MYDGHGGKAAAEEMATAMLPQLYEALEAEDGETVPAVGRLAAPGSDEVELSPEDHLNARMPHALRRAFLAADDRFSARGLHSGACISRPLCMCVCVCARSGCCK